MPSIYRLKPRQGFRRVTAGGSVAPGGGLTTRVIVTGTLTFLQQPTVAIDGQPFSPPIIVQAPPGTQVTLAISAGVGQFVGSPTAVADGASNATFTGLGIHETTTNEPAGFTQFFGQDFSAGDTPQAGVSSAWVYNANGAFVSGIPGFTGQSYRQTWPAGLAAGDQPVIIRFGPDTP